MIRLWKIGLLLTFLGAALHLPAREKDATQYGAGLIVNLPFPASQVAQVVQEIAQNGIIRGTKEFNKDEYITGAVAANSTRVFPEAADGGTVFYKVRLKALGPRNFKDSGDVGTLAVRYIVQPQDDKNTVLRIDARFVEDFRHLVHASNGSVESAELKDIHDHLDAIALMKAQAEEVQMEKRREAAGNPSNAPSEAMPSPAAPAGGTEATTAAPPANGNSPAQTLEQRVQYLKQQVERRVKSPGAPLKSAPFHSATTLQSLPTGTEVLIVIATPYWLGVETHDGQHGWILRDELEFVP